MFYVYFHIKKKGMKYLLSILLFLLLSTGLFSQSSGYLSPTITGTDSAHIIYTDPEYAFVSDDNSAYIYYAQGYPQTQDYSGFGFDSSGYTVDSISVKIEGASEASTIGRVKIELSWDAGDHWTSAGNYVDFTQGNDVTKYIVGAGTFGRTWNISELANSKFRCLVTFIDQSGTPYTIGIDLLQINVYYSPSGAYSPVAGRHVKLYKNGIEKIPYKNGNYLYFKKPVTIPYVNPDLPVIIFAENFDTITTGEISDNQKNAWNIQYGQWTSSRITTASVAGKGNVLKLDFISGINYDPLLNTKLILDSIYHDIYFQYDFYVSTGFNWGTVGGKLFGGFKGGDDFDTPYRGDTTGSGFTAQFIWGTSGYREWYSYTHNANGYGTTMTTTVQMPSYNRTYVSPGVLGKDFDWGYSTSYPYRPNVGYWYAWPSKTYWDGSKYDYVSQSYGQITSGWHTITEHVRMGDGGNHDIFESYIDGVCVFSEDDNRFRTIANINWGVEALYLNAFFNTASPATQYWYVDNIVVYYLPDGNSDFHSTKETVGHTITLMDSTLQLVTSPAMPKTEAYTDASGTIYSFNMAFHHVPGYVTVNKTIHSAGASAYSVTMTSFGYADNSWAEYQCSHVLIYSYTGGVVTLRKTYDEDNYTLGTTIMSSCDSVVITYYTGNGQAYGGGTAGWTMSYTSNGVGSGNNPVYPSPADMVATKPE